MSRWLEIKYVSTPMQKQLLTLLFIYFKLFYPYSSHDVALPSYMNIWRTPGFKRVYLLFSHLEISTTRFFLSRETGVLVMCIWRLASCNETVEDSQVWLRILQNNFPIHYLSIVVEIWPPLARLEYKLCMQFRHCITAGKATSKLACLMNGSSKGMFEENYLVLF